jgi:26S proteasome regulatory subunit T1
MMRSRKRRSRLFPTSKATVINVNVYCLLTIISRDIQVLKTYGAAPYGAALKKLEQQIKEKQTSVNEKIGVKESDTGLAPPHLWDVAADRQRMSEEQPLQVARCTKIIQDEKDTEKSKYVINVKQIAKFVVNLGDRVSPTDIEEGMRVG